MGVGSGVEDGGGGEGGYNDGGDEGTKLLGEAEGLCRGDGESELDGTV